MATVTVECPYGDCTATERVSVDGTVKDVMASWKTGIWGPAKLEEATCSNGHHLGIKYE
ncbi:MAG: hypothetical protein PPP58_06160 [Natronomonas sp.]